ncbi:hypothetical protein AB8O38_18260 [Saccharomonospora xinjiangensis]|uniref:hypothetical protein n=1 Tax=Saccharomonospora xinjiangensis TaxID=75294 RepID=UPI00350FAD9C
MSDPMEVATGAAAIAPGGALVSAVSALNKSMGIEAMAEVTRSADRLVASAKSGGFTVTKEAADPIIKVLEEFIDKVDKVRVEMKVFDQAPKLGNHEYGLLAAHHMHRAANDEQSARAALAKLQIILEKSRDALRIASKQYREQEDSVLDSLQDKED